MSEKADEDFPHGHEIFSADKVENSELDIDYIIPIEIISLEIFRNLTFKDLLNCSLVSKQWNTVARKVLYENKRCSTSLILEEEKEASNNQIIDYLQNTHQKLFNHLIIKMSVGNDHDCEQGCQNLLQQVESFPLQHTNFRHLSLHISFSHEEDCYALQVVKKLCRSIASDKVEHLTLTIKSFRNQLESCSAFRDGNDKFLFSNLRSIEVFVNALVKHEVLEVFFRQAPHLMEIRGKMEASDLPFLLQQNRAYLVKTLDLTQARSSDLDTVLKFAKAASRLKSISFDDNHLLAGSRYMWAEIFSLICKSSKDTLENLYITPPMLNILSQVCPKMSRMKTLGLVFKTEHANPWELLHSIPLGRIFPNLLTVKISHLSQESGRNNRIPEEFYERGEHIVDEPCLSTKNLICINKSPYVFFEPTVIRSLVLLFPNVHVFTFEGTHNYDLTTLFRTLWTVWENMETIRFSASPSEVVALEPTLIGIYNEEWELWREMKVKGGIDLKEMQFAPIRPALRNCCNLQNFLIHLNSDLSYKYFTQGLLDITNEIYPKVVRLAYTGANGNLF